MRTRERAWENAGKSATGGCNSTAAARESARRAAQTALKGAHGYFGRPPRRPRGDVVTWRQHASNSSVPRVLSSARRSRCRAASRCTPNRAQKRGSMRAHAGGASCTRGHARHVRLPALRLLRGAWRARVLCGDARAPFISASCARCRVRRRHPMRITPSSPTLRAVHILPQRSVHHLLSHAPPTPPPNPSNSPKPSPTSPPS